MSLLLCGIYYSETHGSRKQNGGCQARWGRGKWRVAFSGYEVSVMQDILFFKESPAEALFSSYVSMVFYLKPPPLWIFPASIRVKSSV